MTIWEHIASYQIVTSDDLGPVTIWVFTALTQFRNWTPSFETGHPVSKLESIFASSFETGRPKSVRRRFWNENVPVSILEEKRRPVSKLEW